MALVTVQRSPCGSTSAANCHCQTTDEIDGSDSKENAEKKLDRKSASECYFAVKGAALVLPHDECLHVHRKSIANGASDIQQHLQAMFYLLHPDDILKMAVKLESIHCGRTRYLAVVSRTGKQQTEESCLLGIDCNSQTTIGLALPVWADTRITLDGDGGFSVTSSGRHHIFKPVSVQAMWSALQTLHKASSKARECNYFKCGGTHQWVDYYEKRIDSDRSCLNEWHAMDDLESRRPPSPDNLRTQPTEREETEKRIRAKLKELMMSVDLDEVTSKYIRTRLEEILDMDLKEFKPFIDQEMLTILGQMDAPTEIFQYLYLGSEWNASNLEELVVNGIGHILNVTREIDNFFPGMFDYQNVRVYDDESTEILHYWDKTYRYIRRAKDEGSKVLVHCKMGISRSASVVIAYVMKAYDWNLQQALQFVKTKRNCIKPNSGFLKQLEIYQGILDASKHRHNSLWRSKSETNLKSSEKPKKAKSEGQKKNGTIEKNESLKNLKVPGVSSRPKSWSPNDAIADLLFPANNSLSNEALTRKEFQNTSSQDENISLYPENALFIESCKQSSDTQLFTKNSEMEAGAVFNSEKLSVESSIPRVSSIKDRINELESHVSSGIDSKVPKHEIKSPSTQSRSGLVLNLANQFESGSKPSSPVDDGLIMKSTVEEEIVEPVLSQTKPPAHKHHAILVKPSLWPEENTSKSCLTNNSNNFFNPIELNENKLLSKSTGFDSVASCIPKKHTEVKCENFIMPKTVPTEKASHSSSDSAFKSLSCTDKGTCTTLDSTLHQEKSPDNTCSQIVINGKKCSEKCSSIKKMQINGKLRDKFLLLNNNNQILTNAPIQYNKGSKFEPLKQVHLPADKCFEQDASNSNVPSTVNFIYDKEDIPFTPGTVQRTRQQLEDKNLIRTTSFDSGFPTGTRSMPSTPPDSDSMVGKPVRRSHSLRNEHSRPFSMFSGKWYPLPALASFSPKHYKNAQESLRSVCSQKTGMVHSISTPSVVEAVNQVICGTQEILNSAISSIPGDKSFNFSRHVSSDSNYDFGSVSSLPDIDVEDVVFTGKCAVRSESPVPGIVKQQCEILESKAPKVLFSEKSSSEHSKGKKESEKHSVMCSNLVTSDSVSKYEDSKDLGLVKRLTKELEAKTSTEVNKKEKISSISNDGESSKSELEKRSTASSSEAERRLCSGAESCFSPRQMSGIRSSLPTSVEKKLAGCDTIQHGPPTPHRKTSLDLNFLRQTSRCPLTMKIRSQPKSEPSKDTETSSDTQMSTSSSRLNHTVRTYNITNSRSHTECDIQKVNSGRPPPAVKSTMGTLDSPPPPPPLSGPLRKIRKQQGSTHPLSKLTIRQRHNNPIYNTM